MEGVNGLPSTLKNVAYNTARNVPLPPYPFPTSTSSYTDSLTLQSKPNFKSLEGQSYHQRCSSESFLIEEQPSWLDDLLNESEIVPHKGHHRRSASDSYAYFGEAAHETFTNSKEDPIYKSSFLGNSSRSRTIEQYQDVDALSIGTNKMSLAEKNNQESEEIASNLGVDQSREETSSQGSSDRASSSQVKPSSASKTDTKRTKQHNAHRSRVRKLQYIANLERTVQILKAEGSHVSAELEFVEQQNIILTMENRALRQRIDTISQEQIIKHWEQGMLEREIGRLQTLYHVQKQQQMQPNNQHNHNHRHRRNRSRDLDHHNQSNTCNVMNMDSSSSKGSARA